MKRENPRLMHAARGGWVGAEGGIEAGAHPKRREPPLRVADVPGEDADRVAVLQEPLRQPAADEAWRRQAKSEGGVSQRRGLRCEKPVRGCRRGTAEGPRPARLCRQ